MYDLIIEKLEKCIQPGDSIEKKIIDVEQIMHTVKTLDFQIIKLDNSSRIILEVEEKTTIIPIHGYLYIRENIREKWQNLQFVACIEPLLLEKGTYTLDADIFLALFLIIGEKPLSKIIYSNELIPILTEEEKENISYYCGYDKRYGKVYEEGALTWETLEANEIIVFLYQKFPEWFDGDIIDLGCGEGRDTIYLTELGCKVCGVDISRNAITRARKIAKNKDINPIFIERDVIFLRGIENDQYSLALNMGCLHMITNPIQRAKHLSRVYEILKPGGKFVIAHCKDNWGKGFYSIPKWSKLEVGTVIPRRLRMQGSKEKQILLPVIPYKESSSNELKKELIAANFQIVQSIDDTTGAFGDTVLIVAEKLK